jgi:DNA-binding transcriptional LysR family regulator
MRLRICYLPDSLPARVLHALRHLAVSAPRVQVQLETGPALELIAGVRCGRLDAVLTTLPAPTSRLRSLLLDQQRAVVVLPAGHPRANDASIDLEKLAPERLLLLPRDANPGFHNAVVSAVHGAGLAPALVETGAPRVEEVLLSVAAGGGLAIVPESVAERYASPGIRFVPVDGAEPTVDTAVLTRPDDANLGTQAFLHALVQAAKARSRIETPAAAELEEAVA